MTESEERKSRARVFTRRENLMNNTWWRSVATITLGLILASLLLASLWYLRRPLALLVLGIAIAAALAPIISRVENRLPRAVVAILLYLFGVLVLIGMGWIIIPPLVMQAQEIVAQAPNLLEQLEEMFGGLERLAGIDLVDLILPELGRIGGMLLVLPLGVLSSLVEILVVMFISLYLLIEAPNMEKFFLSLFPENRRGRISNILQNMAQAMGGYIRGVAIGATVIGVFMYLGLLVIGVEFPLVLGLLAGLFEVIPYLGPILAAIPIVLIALLESTAQALIVVVFIVILQQVESYVLVPNIMRTQTKVSPLLVLLAIIAGSSLAGLLGVLIAIPLVAALRVFVKEVVAPFVRERTGASPRGEEDLE